MALFEIYHSAIHLIASRDYTPEQIEAWAPRSLDPELWRRKIRDINPFVGVNAWFVANWYWVALGALAASFAYGVLITFSIAPFASACRQLDQIRAPLADEGSPTPVE